MQTISFSKRFVSVSSSCRVKPWADLVAAPPETRMKIDRMNI